MTCPHCEHWAPTLGGEIFACPYCGTREWAMNKSKIDDRAKMREGKRTWILLFGAFIVLMIVAGYALQR